MQTLYNDGGFSGMGMADSTITMLSEAAAVLAEKKD
jgi:hypothetical protein